MTQIVYSQESEATALCKSCGLCCTGHLFSWVRLKAVELNPLEKLGLNVIRSDPRQRGFTQPCPMWDGECSIYDSPYYPRGCDSYKCKLLRELLDERVSLARALKVVRLAKDKIRMVEELLPPSPRRSFRERLIEQVENLDNSAELNAGDTEFRKSAAGLLQIFEGRFGVTDFFEHREAVEGG